MNSAMMHRSMNINWVWNLSISCWGKNMDRGCSRTVPRRNNRSPEKPAL